MRRVHEALASLLYFGYFPVFPATVGSAVTCLAYWFLIPLNLYVQAATIAIVSAGGIYLSSKLTKEWGPDPKRVVIDESAGMLLSLIMVEKSAAFVFLAFILFRLFDIVKPFPIRRSELMRGGWGIVVDDLLAGAYARIVLLVIGFAWKGLR